ncbi:CUB domain-containing protein [Paraglaciecola sp. T6c]|uniref:DUF6701 domain-containing protein n=1 Tax=Pseudoalteromonas atlantica (strain T6c / ATCC BAA-1087) TaxID=3042615 RepID=UPI00005C609A|nr:DUF6701 domain-containing protein [Paraglaciecola sp. T6c]ABG38714.1 CUB domain-containing protein [Paraglaciecola sp. T6c]
MKGIRAIHKRIGRFNSLILLLMLNMLSCSQVLADTLCSDTETSRARGALFDSGGASGNYANNEDCEFTIRAPQGGAITLSFSDFDYEENYDFFSVYDGENVSAPLLGTFSGSNLPSVLVATSGTMFIEHSTDGSAVRQGLAATWSISSNSCSTETFNMADHFPSASYSASSGSAPWSSDWLEAGESDGPARGYLRVNNSLCSSGNCLRLGVVASENPRSYSARFVYRRLNLSDAVTAQLNFNYRVGHNAGESLIRLGISTNGGSTWTNLKDYTITASNFSSTAQSFDISAFIGSNVAIGFQVSGTNSESGFYVDDINVSAAKAEVCDGPAIAFYQFEQEEWATTNSVIDSSASGYDASPLGDAFPTFPSIQTSCQVMSVPKNSDANISAGIDTELRVDTDIGDKGTISFWYRSALAWSNGRGRQLFDASTWIGNANSKYFNLSLRNGTLRFGLEDTTDNDAAASVSGLTFAPYEWVHIAVTYDYSKDSAVIFINGRQASQTSDLGLNGDMPVLDTLYIGDNRSLYNFADSPANSADGEFDDVRIYDYAQSQSQVNTDLDNVSPCAVAPVAIYEFEQVEFNGSQSILDSTSNQRHASPLGEVVSVLSTAQVSCRFADVPMNTDATVIDTIDSGFSPNDIGQAGTISFWYRSNEDWSSNNARQLFDASTDAGNSNSTAKYFYLSLRASTLYFGLEDIDDRDAEAIVSGLNFSAGEWVHVAVGYDYAAKTAVIHINGAEAGRSNSLNLNNNIAQFNTLYFGDNRSDYIVTNMTANSANGQFDNIRVNAYVQNSTEITQDMNAIATCQSIHHYQLEHDGQGLTCETENISIKACADENCTQLYTETSSVELAPDGWRAGNPLVFTGEIINTPLAVLEPELATLDIVRANPSAPLRCLNTGSGIESCDINFVDAGFEFIGEQVTDKFLPDQLSQANFVGANLRAVQNDNGVCKALLQGQQDVTFGVNCVSPNRCLTDFSGIDVSASPDGESTGIVSLTFDADGVASLGAFNYADAGRVALRAAAEINGVSITSGDASVDIAPTKLTLAVAPPALIYTDTDFSVYPSSADTDVYPAGEEFTFNITAYGVLGDIALPNYQPSTLQIAVERILPFESSAAEGTLVFGDGASVLGNVNKQFADTPELTFVEGQYNYQATFSEVGVIRLDIRDIDYLSDNNNPTSVINSQDPITLGEFTPAYFDVQVSTAPELVNQCGNFTYMGQPISFSPTTQVELIAMNALGEATKNFINGYWRYNPDTAAAVVIDDASVHAGASPAVTRITGAASATITAPSAFTGITLIDVPDGTFTYEKVATDFAAYPLIEPFVAAVDMTFLATFLSGDNNVCYQSDYPVSGCEGFRISDATGSNITGVDVNVRHGRLALGPNFGPEPDFLVTPVSAEHYLNGRWQLNQEDNCTNIDLTESSGQIVLSAQGSNDITGQIDSVTSAGTLIGGELLGNSNFALTGSGAGNGPGVAGVVEVSLDPSVGNPSWAQYMNFDWSGDGFICPDLALCSGATAVDGPASIITFGLYRGNDRIIHWREVFH